MEAAHQTGARLRSGAVSPLLPGTEWFPAQPPAPLLRLNYSGPYPDRFDAGARVIAAPQAQQRGVTCGRGNGSGRPMR
jgi:hypothetical protein